LNGRGHRDQVQDQQVEVLQLEETSLLSCSIIPLANEPQQSKLEHQEVRHRESHSNEYICVLNKLISTWVNRKESQVLIAPNFFKNSCVFKNSGILSTMILLRSKQCPYLAWVMIFGNDASGRKEFKAKPSEKRSLRQSKNPSHSPKVD